jgi:hypothetical protein
MKNFLLLLSFIVVFVGCSKKSPNEENEKEQVLDAQTNLTIDVSKVKGTMDGRGVGFCNSFVTDRPELTPNLKKSGAATLRFPMGGLAKNYLFHNFDNDYNDLDQGLRPRVVTTKEYFQGKLDINTTTYEFKSELMDFDEFMVMCNEVGAEPVIMLRASLKTTITLKGSF